MCERECVSVCVRACVCERAYACESTRVSAFWKISLFLVGLADWMQASLVRKMHSIATGVAAVSTSTTTATATATALLLALAFCALFQFTLQMCDLPLPALPRVPQGNESSEWGGR